MGTFPDVPDGHYSEQAVEELAKRGILKGHDDGTFGFGEPLMRQDYATVLWRMIRDGYLNDPYVPPSEPPPPPSQYDRIIADEAGFATVQTGETVLVRPGVYQVGVVPPSHTTWMIEDGARFNGNGGPHAFSGPASHVVIFGGEYFNYDPPQQNGVIESTARRDLDGGWKIHGVWLHDNDEVGIRIGGHGTELTDSLIEDQGRLGFALQYGTGGLAARLEVARCNADGRYSWGFEAGGSKCWKTDSLVCEDIISYGHVGPGLWTDKDNINTVYRRNVISDCRDAPGIFHEISFEATIEENEVRNCGSPGDWLWDAGIQLSTSDGVTVSGNYIEDCGNGISVISQNRGYSDRLERPYYGRNCVVTGNHVVRSRYSGAVRADSDFPDIWQSVFERNTYLGCTGFAWANRWIGWDTWQGFGHDLEGTWD